MIYIGIDIGKNGYIVVISENTIDKFAVPLIGKEVDIKELTNYLKKFSMLKTIVYMEDLHSIYGASAESNHSFGWINGLFEGILTALDVPYVKVQAKKWQKEMFEGIPKQFKMSDGKMKNDTKAMSILASKRLFPDFNLKTSTRSNAVDKHDLSDALLLAAYAKKNYKL